jgi:hypothetical protein
MDKLIQIIRTFDNYKLRHIDVLNNQDSTSRATLLYREIQKGKINSDDEAAQFLFGKNANKGMGKYRVFKTEFKEKVMNTLLFLDTTNRDFDEYQQATYDINKDWMAIKALYSRGMTPIATQLAEQLLATVLQYEYSDIAVQMLPLIKAGVARRCDKKQYAEYQALQDKYVDLWLIEQKAKEYNDILLMEYIKTAAYKPHMSDVAKTYFEELKPYLTKYTSATLHLYSRGIEIYIYSTVNDYKNLLDVAERALSFFNSKLFVVNTAISIFLHQKMIALMMLERYEEATEAINESMKLRVRGSFNWFKGQESKVFLAFRMHNYTEGYALYKEVVSMPEFDKVLTGMNRDMWFFYHAYFHLLHKLGKAKDLVFDPQDSVFKLNKFLNHVPTFNQDKRGMQLAVLIVEICFMMSHKQRDLLIDRIEAIQKHLSRTTLKTEPNYRFNQFGNMLLEIPKSGYSRALLERNTESLFKDLQSVPYDLIESVYRSEPINLEDLWGLVLSNYESLK